MKALIVHAHPEPGSFNGALTAVAAATLAEGGHDVVVSDLYAAGFDPVAGPGEFDDRADPDYFRLDREQTHAHGNGTTAADVAAEQAKLAAADLLVLQFPMWWFGPPAILKGWFDRVLTRGFGYLPGHKYDTGHMSGKLAIVSVTTGTSADTYAPDGIDGSIRDILWPVHNGVLRYTGFEVAEPFVTHMPGRISEPNDRHSSTPGPTPCATSPTGPGSTSTRAATTTTTNGSCRTSNHARASSTGPDWTVRFSDW